MLTMMSLKNTLQQELFNRQAEIGRCSMIELECFLRQQQEEKRHQQDPYKQCLYTEHVFESAMPASVPVQYQRQTAGSPSSSSSDALAAIVSLLDSLQRLQSPASCASLQTDTDNSTAADGPASLGTAAGGMELYKTELCRAFEERGQCRYGDKCQFAHGLSDLRSLDRHPKYKTEMCRTYHSTGFCPYGSRCHFVHNELARSMATTAAATAAAAATQSSSPPSDGAQKQQLKQQFVASLVSRKPLDMASSPVQMSPRGMLYPPSMSVPSSMSMKAPSSGMCIDDLESMLLQHRRRQNLMTLTLQSSTSVPLGSGHLMATPSGQCRLSPPLSAGDSGFSSSTGSPTVSEVFSPAMSPTSPQSYRSPTYFQRSPPPTRYTPMYGNGMLLAQRDWNTPTTSVPSPTVDLGLRCGSMSRSGVDARSRHFFGV